MWRKTMWEANDAEGAVNLDETDQHRVVQSQSNWSSVTVSNGKILIYKKIQSISEWHGKSLSWKMGSRSHLWQTEGFL